MIKYMEDIENIWSVYAAAMATVGVPRRAIQTCACGAVSDVPEWEGWVCDACVVMAPSFNMNTWPMRQRTRTTTVPVLIPKPPLGKRPAWLDLPPADPDHPHKCPVTGCGAPAYVGFNSVECTRPGCDNWKVSA